MSRPFEVLGVFAVGAEHDEQSAFLSAGRERTCELLDLRATHAAGRPLALHLDDVRLDSERVAVGDDVEAAVAGRFGSPEPGSRRFKKVRDEMLELGAFELRRQRLDDEVAGVRLDAVGVRDLGYGLGSLLRVVV